jgi:hypothetical protein
MRRLESSLLLGEVLHQSLKAINARPAQRFNCADYKGEAIVGNRFGP